jgi:DivIVA domain-containing protein
MSRHRSAPLTAQEIRAIRLRMIKVRKGYDPGAVHELLHRLAEETASRDAAIANLTSRLHRAEIEAYARRHGTLPASLTPPELESMAAEVDVTGARQHAGEPTADQEELARLVSLVQWAHAQIAGLHEQVRVTDVTVGTELRGIVARLSPMLGSGPSGSG